MSFSKQGIRYHQGKWPPNAEDEYSYAALRSRGDEYWRHLERLEPIQLFDEVIYHFLNTVGWNCHIPIKNSEKGVQVAEGLYRGVAYVNGLYACLESTALEDTDFTEQRECNGVRVVLSKVIRDIYSAFLRIEPKFGKVPASKLMHMALPNLFVMWDNGIIDR
jgi:hypothetical protein